MTGVQTFSSISPAISTTRYTKWDIFGNVVQADVSCCQVKNITFNSTNYWSQPVSVTSGTAGVVPFLTTSYQYDFNTGLATQTTDPNNLTTYFAYDSAWRPLTVTAPSGAVTTTTPDKDGNGNDQLAYSQQVSYTENGASKLITSKGWFDGGGHVLRSGSGAGSAPTSFDAVATVYDSMGRVLKQSNPYAGDSSGNGSPSYWTSNAYDKLSRVTQVTLPDSQTVRTSYSGSTVTVTDQVGRQRQSTADGLGRMTTVVEQNPATGVLDSVNYQTTYSYDVLDNLTQVNQGNQLRTFVYDGLSRATSQTTPEAGTVSFTYNDSSEVLKRTDARGVETHYKYDALNRPIQVWYTGIGGDDAGTIRPALPSGVATTSDVTISYNNYTSSQPGNGQVSQVTDQAGSESYAYDTLARLSSKTRVIDARSYQTQYIYNTANQMTTLIYPSGKRVRTNHDSRGRMSGLDRVDTSGNLLSSYMTSVGYNNAGQVTSEALANGVNESYGYSADRLQLTSETATKGSTLMSLTFSYAASAGSSGSGTSAGNSGQLVSISGTINSQSRGQAFTYDNVGRLLTATGWSNWNRRYAYDRWGNRTGMWDAITGGNQLQNITIATTGSVANNRIATVNAVSYTYDASGNCTNDGGHSYSYDAEGRQASVDTGATSASTYDSNNCRLKKVGGGATTHYVWEGAQVIAEYNGSTGALISEYVYAGSRMVARDQSGVLRYYHQDRLSTRLITDANGSVAGTEDHFPFGEDTGTGTGENEKHRFTSYERDSESGTDQAINRQHQNANGRFMQPDIVAGSIADPQSLNRFAYSLNDPVNVADPNGLFPTVPPQFNAAYGGPGIYWDGIRLMITEYEMVYRFWQSGAVDVQTGFNEIPEWMRKEYGIQDPNELWRLLPVGLVDCEQKIAQIFGDQGAVGGDHGVAPGKSNSDPIGASKAHVYPSSDGSGKTNVYVPAGYDSGVFVGGSNSTAYFYYGSNPLFGQTDVTLLVQHVSNVPNLNQAKNRPENGRVRIGTTGGLDGGQVNGPNYQHVHIEVFRGKGLPDLIPGKGEKDQTLRNQARIPYRDIFCK